MAYANFVRDALDQTPHDRLCKVGVIRRRRLRRSFEAVGYATLGWMDWYDHSGCRNPYTDISTAEAQRRQHAAADDIGTTADPGPTAFDEAEAEAVQTIGFYPITWHINCLDDDFSARLTFPYPVRLHFVQGE